METAAFWVRKRAREDPALGHELATALHQIAREVGHGLEVKDDGWVEVQVSPARLEQALVTVCGPEWANGNLFQPTSDS